MGGVVAIGANTLQVNGKLRAFTGAAPGTDSNSPGANCITSTGVGKLSIVGNRGQSWHPVSGQQLLLGMRKKST